MEDEETVISESVSEDERRIRVYDHKGDFIITVPAKAKVTFGYFAGAGGAQNTGQYDNRYGAVNDLKRTALRIYEGGEKSNQLACFLGVNGFRDEAIGLTRLSQRVVIETNVNDDGEGNLNWGGSRQKQIVAAPEPDTYA